MSIKRLPEFLINQIKAGEVIERPAALIKELLENALDAHATEITLHLLRAGLDLIHVADNGDGMDQEDLALAFVRHATSKIQNFEDLYHLQSFGFRGEALASAAAVARIACQSAPRTNPTKGHKIILEGEQIKALTPVATTAAGTQFWIRDLFYNTPARLKFVRSVASEKNAIKRIIIAFLLAYPHVHFTLQWDDEDKKIYPATDQVATRWGQIFPAHKDYLAWTASYDDFTLKGLVALSSTTQKNTYLFCNKRYFQDKTLHQIISNQMAPYWQGRSGLYAIFISVSPENIDVNVHPNKLSIKFAHPAPLYALLTSSLKEHLAAQTRPPAPKIPPSAPANSESLLATSPAALGELLWPEEVPPPDGGKAFHFTPLMPPAPAARFNFIRPPELPGYLCYVFQQQSFLIDGRQLLAAYWQKHNGATPLLVVRTWEAMEGFNAQHVALSANYGLAAEIVQDKIFLRAAPAWILQEDLWELVTQLWQFMALAAHGPAALATLWPSFWQSAAAAKLATDIKDEVWAHLLAQLSLAEHRQLALSNFWPSQICPPHAPALDGPEISC